MRTILEEEITTSAGAVAVDGEFLLPDRLIDQLYANGIVQYLALTVSWTLFVRHSLSPSPDL